MLRSVGELLRSLMGQASVIREEKYSTKAKWSCSEGSVTSHLVRVSIRY